MNSPKDDPATATEILNGLSVAVVYVEPIFEANESTKVNEVADFEIQFANDKAGELLGFVNEPVTGKKLIGDNLPDANLNTNVFLQYKQVLETGERHEFNYYHQLLDRHLHVLRKSFKNGVLAITTDRTEQEIADRERNVQTEFVQSMLNASLHGVILIKPVYNNEEAIYDFVVLAANTATAKHLGLQPDVITGKMMSSLVSRYKETPFFDTYITALQTGQVQHRDLYYEDERIQGWFDLGAAPVNELVVVTFANITDTKKTQRAHEEVALYLQTVIDISQTGIFVFVPVFNDDGELIDFRFRIANRTLAAYVGQEPEAIQGALGSTWFPGYKTNGLFNLYSDTYLTGTTNRFDFHYNDDNINVWLDIMSTKFGDEVLVTFADFTPLKELQQQLEASVKELERSNDRLKEFAYVASHDLQEPLRKITTFGNLLEQRHTNNLDEDAKRLIDRMQSATTRMQTLINDLLNYSQMNTRAVNLQKVNLNKVIHEVLIDLDNTIQENKAVVHLAEMPSLSVDEAQLRQVFQNLISNAIKFKKPDVDPEIIIESKQITGKESGITMQEEDFSKLYYDITIADNGIGFEQKYAEQIFQIFQRLHGRSDYPGTGIGLAIVQKAVENHHGYIYSESEPERGAKFHVMLPVST